MSMQVPFVNLGKQFQSIEENILSIFKDVGRSGVYIMGPKLESFEKKIAEYCGTSYAVGVANGSDALFLILKALNIGCGDEVITAANSFIASGWVIAAAGAKPVLVDVSEDMNICPQQIESAITPNTKAIIAVHLTGRPAKMNEINHMANNRSIHVIEDAAQAIGATYYGKKVGSLGIAAGFSLHPLKNLGVYGDGGVITTSNHDLYAKLLLLRNHGLKNRDECELWGFNSRLDALQAAFAEYKLSKLEIWNKRVLQIANHYRQGLCSSIDIPVDQPWEGAVYHNFVIRTNARDSLMSYLLNNGIETRIHYPIPIHLQKASHQLGYKVGDFPLTERYSNTMLSLPIYPELDDVQVSYVISKINYFFQKINPLRIS